MTGLISFPARLRAGITSARTLTMILCSVAVLAAGCDNSRAGRAGVSGTVTFDGEPVSEGAISFVPVEGTQGPLTGGNIQDGRYQIAQPDGPFPGKYRVDVNALRKTGKKVPNLVGELREDGKEEFLPKGKYSGSTSTLKAEIGQGANRLDFELDSR